MKTLVMVVMVLTLALAGCATTAPPMVWKDYGVCLQHGIMDAQNCDAWYDRGGHLGGYAPGTAR